MGTYQAAQQLDGAISLWMLTDPLNSSVAFDSGGLISGVQRPGTVTAVVFNGGSPLPGTVSGSFNGTTATIVVAYAAALAPAVISMECWIWFAANPGSNRVFFDNENTGLTQGCRLLLNTSGQAVWNFQGGGGGSLTSSALALSTWHHVVGTYDGTQARLYVDGALAAGPTTLTYTVNGSGAITIGSQVAAANFFGGFMLGCAIYPSALSLAQVAKHFAQSNGFIEYVQLGPNVNPWDVPGIADLYAWHQETIGGVPALVADAVFGFPDYFWTKYWMPMTQVNALG